jgi:hypothetical protein
MGDGHSGGTTGLTHPDYEVSDKLKPHGPRRRELWKRYATTIEAIKPIDFVIDTGDCVQGFPGRGKKNDELLSNELIIHAEMAIEARRIIDCPHGQIVHGTPSHVGDEAHPIEEYIADELGWNFNKICEDLTIRDTNFHIKHFIGGSNRSTTIGNMLKVVYTEIVNNHHAVGVPSQIPDIVIRGHRHIYTNEDYGYFRGIIAPCLQTWGASFAVKYEGRYPTPGLMWFDIFNGKANYNDKKDLFKLENHRDDAPEPIIYDERRCPECGGPGHSKGKTRMRCKWCSRTWAKEAHDHETTS